MSTFTDGLWLRAEKSDNGWIKDQIASFNARVGDFVVGGRNSPRPEDLKNWRKRILAVREKYSKQ